MCEQACVHTYLFTLGYRAWRVILLISFVFLPTAKIHNKVKSNAATNSGIKTTEIIPTVPLGDDRGLIWRLDCAAPDGVLWGAAEHPSPLGPGLLGGHRWRVVIVLGGGGVPVAITLLGQRLHLVP